MNSYNNIANSFVLYTIGILILIIVFVQSVLFIRHAWKEGTRIGMSKDKLKTALRTSMISSIVPSLPILVGIIALTPLLGHPFSWFRLSIVGSVPYELMAAGIGADSMGVDGLKSADFTANVFANCIWVMTIGAIWSSLFTLLSVKRFDKIYSKIGNNDPGWTAVLTNTAFFGVVSVFLMQPVVKGGVSLATLACGAAIMLLCVLAIVVLKVKKLKEFALPISMIGAMVFAAIIQ